jgi:hypothetical protein
MRTLENVQSKTSGRWEYALPRLTGMRIPLPSERTTFPEDKCPVVDLAHFAAIGGLTRREYLVRMMEALRSGRLESVLRPEALEDMTKTMSRKKKFVLCFQMSLNKPVDSCLYCLCERKGESFSVGKIIPGLIGRKPRSVKLEDRTFEVAFCDMRTTI